MKPVKIIPVSDPPTPAIAYEDDTHTIVEVDDHLEGKDRKTAIMAALTVFRHGALVPLPVALAWDNVRAWGRTHPVVVRSGAVTTAVGVTLGAVFVPSLLNDQGRRQLAEPPPSLIVTITPTPTTPSATPARTRRPDPPPAESEESPPPAGTRQVPEPTGRSPTSTPTRTTSTSPSAPTTKPSPTPTPAPTTPPIVDASPTPAPTPAPPIAAESECDGLIEVNLRTLARACALG